MQFLPNFCRLGCRILPRMLWMPSILLHSPQSRPYQLLSTIVCQSRLYVSRIVCPQDCSLRDYMSQKLHVSKIVCNQGCTYPALYVSKTISMHPGLHVLKTVCLRTCVSSELYVSICFGTFNSSLSFLGVVLRLLPSNDADMW